MILLDNYVREWVATNLVLREGNYSWYLMIRKRIKQLSVASLHLTKRNACIYHGKPKSSNE